MEAENARLRSIGEAPRSLGSTEMGRVIAASNGLVDGTTIQIPTTGYHSMEETTAVASVEAFLKILHSVANG